MISFTRKQGEAGQPDALTPKPTDFGINKLQSRQVTRAVAGSTYKSCSVIFLRPFGLYSVATVVPLLFSTKKRAAESSAYFFA